MTTDKFNAIKSEILNRAKAAQACKEQYSRAYMANNFAALIEVVKDNFNWCCENKVITAELIEEYREEFAAYDIRANEDADSGYLLVDGETSVTARGSASVRAYDSATVRPYGSARVTAYGSAMVEAHGSATVWAYGSAKVEAYGSATVMAYGSTKVEAYGSAKVEAYGSAKVKADGSAKVRAYDSTTVKAYGYVYCRSHHRIDCTLHDYALHHVTGDNTVYYVSDNLKFVKQ